MKQGLKLSVLVAAAFAGVLGGGIAMAVEPMMEPWEKSSARAPKCEETCYADYVDFFSHRNADFNRGFITSRQAPDSVVEAYNDVLMTQRLRDTLLYASSSERDRDTRERLAINICRMKAADFDQLKSELSSVPRMSRAEIDRLASADQEYQAIMRETVDQVDAAKRTSDVLASQAGLSPGQFDPCNGQRRFE